MGNRTVPFRPPSGTAPGLLLPDDRILVRAEVEGLARIYWPASEIDHAVAVAMCESGFHTGAWAYAIEDSRGLWQINILAHPTMGLYNLGDPQICAYFAHQLWAAQGWGPWSCAHKLGIV